MWRAENRSTCLPDFLLVDGVEPKEPLGVWSIVALENGCLDDATTLSGMGCDDVTSRYNMLLCLSR